MTLPEKHMTTRSEVLFTSLAIEQLLSQFLAELLNIPDFEQSNSFSNKSGNLSFDSKVKLLIDMSVLKHEDKNDFKTFMEVRNQFMHNLSAGSYVNVFNYVSEKKKSVLRLITEDEKQKHTEEEDQLRIGFKRLSDKVLNLTTGIVNAINEKIINKATDNIASQLGIALILSNGIISSEFDKYIDGQKDKLFTSDEVKQLYHKYTGKIFETAQQKVTHENDKKSKTS